MGYFGKLAWTGVAFVAMALVAGVSPALGIQPTVEDITQEADGTATYHFKIKTDETIRVEGQEKAPNPDFFTLFNFNGMVPGSEMQPPGWTFSTSTNGVTPYRGARTVLSPVDIEGIPNLLEPDRCSRRGTRGDFWLLSAHNRKGHHRWRIWIAGDA